MKNRSFVFLSIQNVMYLFLLILEILYGFLMKGEIIFYYFQDFIRLLIFKARELFLRLLKF